MDTRIEYIQKLASTYAEYQKDPDVLFQDLNQLSQEVLQSVYAEYANEENRFQPVNAIRAEVAGMLLNNISVTSEMVEEMKEKIIDHNAAYFNYIPEAILNGLESYATDSNRNIFANWQEPWRIFIVYFYRDTYKEVTKRYLSEICNNLLDDLHLQNKYTFHIVDFTGTSNFGSTNCWFALFPSIRPSHQLSYQLFSRIDSKIECGIIKGRELESSNVDTLKSVTSYTEMRENLLHHLDQVDTLNSKLRNYFQFSPEGKESSWVSLKNEEVIGIDYGYYKNLRKVSKQEIIHDIQTGDYKMSSVDTDLWSFKNANINDVVFVSNSLTSCIAIGIISGEYYYDESASLCPHRRKVKWIVDKSYVIDKEYLSERLKKKIKNLFVRSVWKYTKIHKLLLSEYLRKYPELEDILQEHDLVEGTTSLPPDLRLEDPTDDEIGNDSSEGEIIEGLSPNYWWLNANPSIWKISEFHVGQKQTYTTHNAKGNKRRIYAHFEALAPGDIVLGYQSSPIKQIVAIFKITKGIHLLDGEDQIEFELQEKLDIPVSWNELKDVNILKDCEVFINNQGSLFKLTDDEYDIMQNIIDDKQILNKGEMSSSAQKIEKPYNYELDADKPFLAPNEFRKIVSLLNHKKNIILQGPPGTGKTFLAKKLAYELMKMQDDSRIEMVQFHQSYSYEDFIQGFRPTLQGGFTLKDGVFYSFSTKGPLLHPKKSYFFIIDEINRGNISKIFGELLMLIERDKRSEKHSIKLTYAEDDNDTFYIPENLYLIGTMNTADRSLSLVDYALRRRFAFVDLEPEFGKPFQMFLAEKGISDDLIEHICNKVGIINAKIQKDQDRGSGFRIGHSFFCSYDPTEDIDERVWYENVIDYEITPLLKEMWFDDIDQAKDFIKELQLP